MTSFHCKKCGTSVNGVGPEKRWTCPKCKNVALREQLEKLADQDSINEKELIKSNKMLQKMFRKFKRVPEEDSGDEADSEPESIEKNDTDFIPDIPQKIPGVAKRKLILGHQSHHFQKWEREKINHQKFFLQDLQLSLQLRMTQMIVNVRLIELFQSSRNYYPGQAFDNSLNKFFGTAAEKAALAKKIQKKKEEIKEYLGRFFGGKKT